MSLQIQIPGRSTLGSNLPILGFDQDNIVDGALLYIEPARQALGAVPALGDKITNFARGSLSTLTGEDMADLDAEIATDLDGGNRLIELTSAGALHGFFDTSVSSAATDIFKIGLPQALLDYIDANDGHTYYIDAVIRGTADPAYHSLATGIPWQVSIASGTSGSTVIYGIKNQSDSDNSDSANYLIYPAGAWADVLLSGRTIWLPPDTTSHARVARSSNPLDYDAAGADDFSGVNWIGPQAPGGNIQGGPGFVFYSMYAEDCSVSGRSWEEAQAWRAAQYVADFGAGGRYDAETWTDPSTYSW